MFPIKAAVIGAGKELDSLKTELASAGLEIEYQFSDAAELRREWAEPPAGTRLLVMLLASDEDLHEFRHLSEYLAGWPSLIGLVGDYDARAVVRVNRAGAAQIVTFPWVEDDVHVALDRVATQLGSIRRPGKLIAVGGTAEGCGAITLAINLAAEAAATWRVATVLAEPAHTVGRFADRLDVEPKRTVDRLYAAGMPTRAGLQSTLLDVTDRLRLLAGPPMIFPAKAPDPAHVTAVVDLLRRSAEVAVIELPCTMDALYFDLLSHADDAVFVAAQQVPDLHAMRSAKDSLEARKPGCKIHLAVTRFDPDRRGFEKDRLKQVLQAEEIFPVRNDPACVDALNAGKPLCDLAPRSPSRVDILAIATRILGQAPDAAPPASSGLFRWWTGD